MKIILSGFFLAWLGFFPLTAAESSRPNIVLIMSDDQGYGDLALHGNKYIKTPNLDAFAKNNIQFERFFVSPLCAPTRASLLTGRYSLRTGVKGVARGEETMNAEEITLAEALRGAGYRTGIFGKWHNGENFPYTPNGQGFDESFGFNLGHWNNYFDSTFKHNGQPEKTKGYAADVFTDKALNFIESNRTRSFFCYLAFNTPHSPLQVPDRYFDRYKAMGLEDKEAAVYGMCENIDDNVGRLLKRLAELKLDENTIVIYLSDNGPHGVRYNAGMRGTKGSLHEGGSRVPFFLRWPERFNSPQIITNIAAHIDLFPTLLELCRVPLPKGFPLDGRSLVPLLEGKTNAWPDRILFSQHQSPRNKSRVTGALRTQQFRMVNEGRGWELFDMQADPGETKDVSAEFSAKKRELIAAYETWWKEVLPVALKPKPPISVGYAQENPVELSVAQSEFTGDLRFSGKHPNNAWLTGWTNVHDTITWNLDVVREGNYEITLVYLCPKKEAGSKVQIASDDSSIEALIKGTDYHEISSPDRVPREEVYEMEWSTLTAGSLDLHRGNASLKIRALNPAHSAGQIMDLKAVKLRRLK